MVRYMLHLVNQGYTPQNAKQLLGDARQMCSRMDIIIRDCRVSVKCVEFDISLNTKTTDELVERLLPIGQLERANLITEEYTPKDDAIKLGIEYFNAQRFWECHEVLEGVWKKCSGSEKDLVQGIILVAAAFVHIKNSKGTYDPVPVIISGCGAESDGSERVTEEFAKKGRIGMLAGADVLAKTLDEIK